jgi:ferredoxin
MGILRLIAGNLQQKTVTLRFPERVAPPEGFRGLVELDTESCVGCGTCAYVCPSSAITVTAGETHYQWDYDPGRCTFCGRCVDVCPSRALSMAADRPPVYDEPGALRLTVELAYPRCAECGRSAPPINDAVLRRAFPEISDKVRHWSRLCTHCRQRRYQPALLDVTGSVGRN